MVSNSPVNSEGVQPIIDVNANWVTLMPFGFMKNTSDTTIQYNSKRQWWGETKVGIAKTAIEFHNKKIKIMLKPQIWIPNGGFLWKWYDMKNAGGLSDIDYTIQNKPCEKLVSDWYKKMQ